MKSSSEPEPPPPGGLQPWTMDLDADLDLGPITPATPPTHSHPIPARAGALAPPSSRARRITALLAVVLVGIVAAIWHSEPEKPAPAVLGTRLAAPIALTRPVGAVTTADGSYVGLQFAAGGVVLVTVPTEVVEPSGERRSLPTDPAAWLAGHPGVFVSRVRTVRLGPRDIKATQMDYRRSRMNAPPSQFARLSLFCGWRPETGTTATACTQITADARVRATFVPVGGQTVLVEAVWPADADGAGRMPRDLQRAYISLLAGVQLMQGAGTGGHPVA